MTDPLHSHISIEKIHDSGLYDIHPYLRNEPIPAKTYGMLKKIGILTPPVIIRSGDNETYDLVTGRNRLYFLSEIEKDKTCLCRILPLNTAPDIILAIILEDQYSSNGFTLVEQAYFLKLCRKIFPEKEQFHAFIDEMPMNSLTKGSRFLSQLLELDHFTQKKIHQNVISEKAVNVLFKYNENDQKLLIALIEQLQLSSNKQKKLLTEIYDATRRAGISVQLLLDREEIRNILSHEEMNEPQKSAKLFDCLHKINYPLLRNAVSSFRSEVKKLRLPHSCSLISPDAFEKDEVTLSIRFVSIDAFKKSWDEIKNHIPDVDIAE